MKKILALTLCVVMLMALSLTAFADAPNDRCEIDSTNSTGGSNPGAEPQATCGHNSWRIEPYYDTTECAYVSNAGHHFAMYDKMVCTVCGCLYSLVRNGFGPTVPHSGGTLYNATCNGTTQTWYYRSCSACHANYTTLIPCAGGPHPNRPCIWLPLSVKPPLVTE